MTLPTPAVVLADHYNKSLDFNSITVSRWGKEVDVETVQDCINTTLLWEQENDVTFVALDTNLLGSVQDYLYAMSAGYDEALLSEFVFNVKELLGSSKE
jgi:hypothetical protein